ncbi:MAG: glycoside hydrolase 43 family protein [Lachnospiraceae bacterium]|nr:glycoside hydrolase 43 family protein [Lachnospiraceae bacterium]
MNKNINPIIKTDYPDPDVVRVGDVYYMVSTTMYFMPGGALLKSYDLINWEPVGYLFDRLDDSAAERMEQEKTEYAGGMWAPSLKYHNGRFYCFFVSHSAKVNYLFSADKFEGPWERQAVEGNFHDASILFDEGRTYVVYGNRDIYITELNDELTGPKENGLHRLIVHDDHEGLGYEGAHIYKIGKYYYLFLINWPKGSVRTQNCFRAESLTGDFRGGRVLKDCGEFPGRGAAQGGIVDTPDGRWFSIMFRDMGAVGRIPVLCPVTWEDDMPVFGVDNVIPAKFPTVEAKNYKYAPLYTSDSFDYPVKEDEKPELKLQWQWNHQPDPNLWAIAEDGGLRITTGKICANLTHARDTLTQRMMWPKCEARVTVDSSELNDGDFAGLCVLQSRYAMVGIKKELAAAYLVVVAYDDAAMPRSMGAADYMPGRIMEKLRLKGQTAKVAIKADFENDRDEAEFWFLDNGEWRQVGDCHRMVFDLSHFTGNRFGLCAYSTRKTGGAAVFTDFEYLYD